MGGEWEVPAVPGLALDARVVHTGARYADSANTLRVPGWTRRLSVPFNLYDSLLFVFAR